MKMLDEDIQEPQTLKRPVSTDSHRSGPWHMASPPEVRWSPSPTEEDGISSSPPERHAKRHLPSDSVPPSSPYKETDILKGTGPALAPRSSHRPRPDVTYNLKTLSHQTRSRSEDSDGASKGLPKQTDFIAKLKTDTRTPGSIHQTSDERQPAKRRRINEDSGSLNGLNYGGLYETDSELDVSSGPVYSITVNQELIDYVWPILLGGGVTKPSELLSLEYYRHFICLPRKRDIQWNPNTACDRWSFRNKIDVAALLVQLTGDPSPKCCGRCAPEMGLFKGCIVTASETLAGNYYGCANCLYHGRQTFCSHKAWNQERAKKSVVHEHSYRAQQTSADDHPATLQPASFLLRQSSSSTASTRGGPVVQAPCSNCRNAHATCSKERPSCWRCRLHVIDCKYSEKVAESIGTPQRAMSPVQLDADTTITSSQPTLVRNNPQGQVGLRDPLLYPIANSVPNGFVRPAVQQGEANQTNTHIHSKQKISSSGAKEGRSDEISTMPSDIEQMTLPLTVPGRLNETFEKSGEVLSMERWERAPGRIRSQVSAENIAFSKSYLATGAEIQVCREATFRVQIIRSGHTHRMEAEDDSTRICSVATVGKLTVKLDGEEPLVIGPHGMFTIRPHLACLVESEIYDDVALHITSVKTT